MKRGVVFCVLIVVLVLLRVMVREGFQGAGLSVVICKAEWSGHCKKAAPEFEKLVAASPITLSNGKQATVKMLDADTDKDEGAINGILGF